MISPISEFSYFDTRAPRYERPRYATPAEEARIAVLRALPCGPIPADVAAQLIERGLAADRVRNCSHCGREHSEAARLCGRCRVMTMEGQRRRRAKARMA